MLTDSGQSGLQLQERLTTLEAAMKEQLQTVRTEFAAQLQASDESNSAKLDRILSLFQRAPTPTPPPPVPNFPPVVSAQPMDEDRESVKRSASALPKRAKRLAPLPTTPATASTSANTGAVTPTASNHE